MSGADDAADFEKEIRPILKENCIKCHSTEKQKGDFDMERFSSLAEIKRHPKAWQGVAGQLANDEMPPKDKPQPPKVSRGDKSVLDSVLADATDLRRHISANDQRKLDEYLDSVRDVDRRIENAGKKGELQGWRPSLAKPNIPRPADGLPQDIGEHMRLMADILMLGFQTNTTRISTLKLNNDHSSVRFPNLGVDYMIHHLLSHSDSADWLKVNQFFVEQAAYIARKLDAVQEGPRTLLDNTMLMYCSSMMTGNHNNDQLPVLLIGGGGCRIKGGLVLDYSGNPERQMSPDMPPLSLDDEQDERASAQVRRRLGGAGGSLTRASLRFAPAAPFPGGPKSCAFTAPLRGRFRRWPRFLENTPQSRVVPQSIEGSPPNPAIAPGFPRLAKRGVGGG